MYCISILTLPRVFFPGAGLGFSSAPTLTLRWSPSMSPPALVTEPGTTPGATPSCCPDGGGE